MSPVISSVIVIILINITIMTINIDWVRVN